MEEARQNLHLQNRATLSITAVTEIISFQEEAMELDTALGRVQITGSGLHVEKVSLESGDILITGRIDSIYYPASEENRKKGLFSRLWG